VIVSSLAVLPKLARALDTVPLTKAPSSMLVRSWKKGALLTSTLHGTEKLPLSPTCRSLANAGAPNLSARFTPQPVHPETKFEALKRNHAEATLSLKLRPKLSGSVKPPKPLPPMPPVTTPLKVAVPAPTPPALPMGSTRWGWRPPPLR